MIKNGASVETISKKEEEKQRKEYYERRENRPDYELQIGVPWRGAGRAAREAKLITRAQKRKRR